MALSTAQDKLLCQLCESDMSVKYKCLDCELFICKKCHEKVHPKFKNAKDHKIVDIVNIGQAVKLPELNYTTIKCKQDTDQMCCIYCEDCGQLLCPSCLTSGHFGHKFIEIKSIYQKKLDQMKNAMRHSKFRTNSYCDELIKLMQWKKVEGLKFSKMLEEVEAHKNILKEQVDQFAQDIIDNANKNQDTIENIFSSEHTRITQQIHSFEILQKRSEHIFSTQNMSVFFDEVDNIVTSLDQSVGQESNRTSMPLIPCFKPGMMTAEVFGILEKDQKMNVCHISLTKTKQYTTDLNFCQILTACPDGSLWICTTLERGQAVLQKVKPDGQSLQVKHTNKKCRVYDMQYSSHFNNILIADKTSTIKIVNGTTGEMSNSKYTAMSLFIVAVHLLPDQKVLLAARSIENPFQSKGRGMIVKMDYYGRIEKEWEYDSNGQKLFISPRFVTSADNGNIFVIDWTTSSGEGKVLGLNEENKVLCTYGGHSEINKEGLSFRPSAIRRSPSDIIIVCDVDVHTLHFLNNDGQLVSYFDLKILGIELPYCLSFNEAGNLYIGCTNRLSDTAKAKLYEVDFKESTNY